MTLNTLFGVMSLSQITHTRNDVTPGFCQDTLKDTQVKIVQQHHGPYVQPLERITLTDIVVRPQATIVVRDGKGRIYTRLPAQSALQFTVAGTLGWHSITLESEHGAVEDTLLFQVDTRTAIADQEGRFQELLAMLYYTKCKEGEYITSVRYQQRIYQCFVGWLRDDVHEMKGMKYFSHQLKDSIDLFRESQREDGMIWDNITLRGWEPNYWETRLAKGDFIRILDDYSAEFKRIPVENDVEYLFVEGIYYVWKATSDDAWMAECMDAAIKALNYTIASPYRWSETYQLLKRGYTIDTWDFQNTADSVVDGDPMLVDPERTHFGIMFGDNTGYAVACEYLAEMLDYLGRTEEADEFRQRGQDIRHRLYQLSWNGRYFTHHVPEHPERVRQLGVDEASQLSLSNAYSLNRRIPHDYCVAIIQSYQHLREHLPAGSPGEWYTIYPPFEQGFGGHESQWQYMNGGVTPIVAGELAHGAFQHGFERYAVDILERLCELGRKHGGVFHSVYTGAFPQVSPPLFHPIDISSQANIDVNGAGAEGVTGWTGEGDNDLHELPCGLQTMAGIPFLLPDPEANGRRAAIGISRRTGYSPSATVPVERSATTIYFLHTVAGTDAGGVAGLITLHYTDGTTFTRYVVRGYNVQGWWLPQEGDRAITRVAWRGQNAHCRNVGVLAYGFTHPYPEKTIKHILFDAARGEAFWGIVGVTLSDQPVKFPVHPVSSGIPDAWGSSAVMYALIEGLAGVVDDATAFTSVTLSPRWSAAGVQQVQATVKYPISDGYITYHFQHRPESKQIMIEVTGSGDTCNLHILLPEQVTEIIAVEDGETRIDHRLVSVEQSRYVDCSIDLHRSHHLCIRYA